MCGRAVCSLTIENLKKTAKTDKVLNDSEYTKSYNVTPGKSLPVFYLKQKENTEKEKSSEIEDFNLKNNNVLEIIKWGSKNKDNKLLINARSENVQVFSTFKACKRCVVIIDGYYEWQYLSEGKEHETPKPFYIRYKEKTPMLLAGLYNINTEDVNIL